MGGLGCQTHPMPQQPPIPDPAVVVLLGASGSGKSTWAAAHYRAAEIVSSDDLRGIVGSGPADLDASTDAFSLLDQIVAARTSRHLTTVIDTLGLEPKGRRSYLEAARRAKLPAVAVIFDVNDQLCRRRNAARDRPVPAAALTRQMRGLKATFAEVAIEGWDAVVRITPEHADREHGDPHPAEGQRPPFEGVRERTPSGRLQVVLQLSRFPWGTDPAGWLTSIATTADQVGLDGIALMDHLVQIPQVAPAWEPIPQPWVTLGLLAGLDTSLRLGTLVSPVTFHAAGVLAKMAATLDALTGGRAFVGLGAGWWRREHDAFGLPFPPACARLDELTKTIETMRALWAPGTKAYEGGKVSLPETTCYPRPTGSIPIIVGGSGERRTLKIAAESADGCNLPSDLDILDHKIEVLRAHCMAAGRDPGEVEITVLDLPVIGRDRDDVAARVERLRGRTATAAFARQHHAGPVADHIRRYDELAQRGVGTVFLALPDLATPADLERCAPLVAAFH